MWRAGPLRDSGNVGTKRGVVDLVDEDPEESGGLLARVRLELRLDIDDKGSSDGGEQTSLSHKSVYVCLGGHMTHEDQGCVQIFIMFLQELPIVLIGHLSIILVKSSTGILLGRHETLFSTVGGFHRVTLQRYKKKAYP